MQAAVGRVQDSSFIADGPAFRRVKKLNVQQVSRHTGALRLPELAAVDRAINAAATAYCPTHAAIELNDMEPLRIAQS